MLSLVQVPTEQLISVAAIVVFDAVLFHLRFQKCGIAKPL